MRCYRCTFIKLLFFGVFLFGPVFTYAATTLEVSGWIPYWRASEGTRDAKAHLSQLDEVYPFGYSVKDDGELKDLFGLKKSSWKKFVKSAQSKKVKIIPTVMWSDAGQMNAILSDAEARGNHVDAIVSMVKKGKYAGVDIDYEGKWAATRDSFSAFLKELKAGLGTKELRCTIEARTPPDSLYTVVPATLEYSNDYVALNTYCDRVIIMGYDQGRADLKLDALRKGEPYVPVADVDWVRKVLELTLKTISKDKLVLGIPTYGREYQVTVSPNWFQNYSSQGSVNPDYALNVAKEHSVTPSRNNAGEISFSYETFPLFKYLSLSIPRNTSTGNQVAAKALAFANTTGVSTRFNLIWWSDAEAVKQKIDLAQSLGIKGVALFKIDGGEDQAIWDLF